MTVSVLSVIFYRVSFCFARGAEKKSLIKRGTPVADGRMGYPDIHHSTQNQSDVAKRVFAQIEHG